MDAHDNKVESEFYLADVKKGIGNQERVNDRRYLKFQLLYTKVIRMVIHIK